MACTGCVCCRVCLRLSVVLSRPARSTRTRDSLGRRCGRAVSGPVGRVRPRAPPGPARPARPSEPRGREWSGGARCGVGVLVYVLTSCVLVRAACVRVCRVSCSSSQFCSCRVLWGSRSVGWSGASPARPLSSLLSLHVLLSRRCGTGTPGRQHVEHTHLQTWSWSGAAARQQTHRHRGQGRAQTAYERGDERARAPPGYVPMALLHRLLRHHPIQRSPRCGVRTASPNASRIARHQDKVSPATATTHSSLAGTGRDGKKHLNDSSGGRLRTQMEYLAYTLHPRRSRCAPPSQAIREPRSEHSLSETMATQALKRHQ